MAGLLDSFFFEIGWKTDKLKQGEKDIQGGAKRTSEALDKSGKNIEARNKRTAESFVNLKSEVVGLLVAFSGASTLKQFIGNIVSSDAATGRLARNIGTSTEALSTWQQVAKQAGGTAADADAAFRMMNDQFNTNQLGMLTGKEGDLLGLGLSPSDLADTATAMLKLSDAADRLPRREFVARLQRLGLSDSIITSLAQGRRGVEAQTAAIRANGVATDESAAASARFEAAMAKTRALLEAKIARNGLAEALDQINDRLEHGVPLFNKWGGWFAKFFDEDTRKAFDALDRATGFQPFFGTNGKPGTSSASGGRQMIYPDGMPGAGGGPRRGNALAGNNPGGINDGGFARSQPGYAGPNGRFASFTTLAAGEAAQRELLRRYVRQGYDTPATIAARWAPAGDGGNDPTAYANNVARKMGIGVNDRIGDAQIARFANAQAMQENSAYGQLRGARQANAGMRGHSAAGSSNQTTIGTINVNTKATDAKGVAASLPTAIKRRGLTAQANTGLSG